MSQQEKESERRPYRNDLHIFSHGKDRDGSPAWLLHDPSTNRYFRLGWLEFEILSRWHMNDVQDIIADIVLSTTLKPDQESISSF
ncbi:MAG: peptidase M50, partial [Alphaproteobacteria bacterium]|nr:peptidase M50 [Alphaproteobacteria bacterium]